MGLKALRFKWQGTTVYSIDEKRLMGCAKKTAFLTLTKLL